MESIEHSSVLQEHIDFEVDNTDDNERQDILAGYADESVAENEDDYDHQDVLLNSHPSLCCFLMVGFVSELQSSIQTFRCFIFSLSDSISGIVLP